MKAATDLLCALCLCLILFAAIGGFMDGLELREAKALAGLGLLLGIAGVSIDKRLP